MNVINLVFTYSLRLIKREWRHFVLPFASLAVTAVVLVLILLLTSSSSLLLSEQSKFILGGDVVVESSVPFDIQSFWEETSLIPQTESEQIFLNGTLQSTEETASFSIQVVDQNYPLYGELVLEDRVYESLDDNEILLDKNGAERLNINIGDKIVFGESEFTLAGIIKNDPTSLLGGFNFLPKAILNQTGFTNTKIDPAFLRLEYQYAARFDSLSNSDIETINKVEEEYGRELRVRVAAEGSTGLQFGLKLVSDFLIIAVLITAVLAAVNVYSSTLYLITTERKSLAVMLSLGMRKKVLVAVLATTLAYAVLVAGIFGSILGIGIFYVISDTVLNLYQITLPTPDIFIYLAISLSLIIAVSISSFIPAIQKSLSLNPKQILVDGEVDTNQKADTKSLLLTSVSSLLPLMFLASFLLQSITQGIITIAIIAAVYILIALAFSYLLYRLYQSRNRFSFFIKSIISQKKADGLFGIVSFTSLFIALTALSTLALLQISLERYLTDDLSGSIPTTYVLDVQPSQKDQLLEEFNEIELYSNIGARIIEIDGVLIQEEIESGNTEIDRELRREFNITSSAELQDGEQITNGTWHEGRTGEISVDEELAGRAGVELGSSITFLIQGFEVSGEVTSLRQTESRSGLPFFYFILSPTDLELFPGVYFGYADYPEATQRELGNFLAETMPNVTLIETGDIGEALIGLIQTLLILIFIVTLPPLLIATLLVTTLVISSYSLRKRDGAKMRAVGATRLMVLKHYLSETISLTLVAAIVSYVLSLAITFIITKYYLELDSTVFFDLQLISGLALIVLLVALIGFYLFKTDTMQLRQLLSYDSSR